MKPADAKQPQTRPDVTRCTPAPPAEPQEAMGITSVETTRKLASPVAKAPAITPADNPAIPSIDKTAIAKTLRYPALLGRHWRILPPAIQRRFMKYTHPRAAIIYQGRVHKTRLSRLGRVLARVTLVIGSPLPLEHGARGPATVIVREATDFNGQYWTRVYPTSRAMPQVIQSAKKFAGPTGLEEMISPRIGVALTLRARRDSLSFTSSGYFLLLAGRRIPIPRILSPGQMTVTHRQTGRRRFRFTLQLTHPVVGELVYQTGIFEELEQ